MKTLRINPRMFISKPYKKCPSCGRCEFGVSGIYDYMYTRKCCICGYTKSFDLPELKKKIIYLDQFVISNMMKSINKAAGKIDRVDKFYFELFKKLDRLNKLQLIICPDSPIHEEESLLASDFKSHKRMYEQLSRGLSFYHPDTIRRFQVYENFLGWFGKEMKELNINDVLLGSANIDGWESRMFISVDRNIPQDYIDSIRKSKLVTLESIKKVTKVWKNQGRSFDYFYKEELDAFGPSIARCYFNNLIDYYKSLFSNELQNTLLLDSLFSETSVLMSCIQRELNGCGLNDEEVIKKSIEYLYSNNIKRVTSVVISSAIYASLAEQFSNFRLNEPTQGFLYDVGAISSYATYCDALFIDNECRSLLSTKGAISNYDLTGKLFSLSNKEDFMSYLDEIENSMSKSHYRKVKEVYGDSWPEPFIDMYEN